MSERKKERAKEGVRDLTSEEVFTERISQKLAQGFQLITSLSGNEPFPKTPTSGTVLMRLTREEVRVRERVREGEQRY